MGAVTQQDQHGRDGAARDRDGDRTDRDRDRDRAARDRAAADLVAKANKESRMLAWLRVLDTGAVRRVILDIVSVSSNFQYLFF